MKFIQTVEMAEGENMETVSTIAKYFLWKAKQEHKAITNKKLQKLLYYSQAWHLVFTKKPLFNDKIEAWIHGPAIRSIYTQYKQYGYGGIDTSRIEEKDFKELSVEDRELLDEVWSIYGKFDSAYLEELTHSETPWQEARENLDEDESSNNEISLDSMERYYREMLEKEKQQANGQKS